MHHSSAYYEQFRCTRSSCVSSIFGRSFDLLRTLIPFLSMGAGSYVTSPLPLLVSMKPSRVKAETRLIANRDVLLYYNGYPLSLAYFKLGCQCSKICSFCCQDSNSSLFTCYPRSTSPQVNRTWEYRKFDFIGVPSFFCLSNQI